MVLYLDHMCQCGLHGWSAHHNTHAPPRCRTSQYSRTFQEHGQCFFIGLSCSIPTIVFYSFRFLLFLSIGWYCGAEVLGLIGCISLSLNLALPTLFNNNNNDNKIRVGQELVPIIKGQDHLATLNSWDMSICNSSGLDVGMWPVLFENNTCNVWEILNNYWNKPRIGVFSYVKNM